MNIPFLRYRKIYFTFSGILVLGSIVSLIIFGLNLGIEFTGGGILRVEYQTARPSNEEIMGKISDLDLGQVQVQPIGEKGIILRMQKVQKDTREKVLERLAKSGEIVKEETSFESIGPMIGRELKQKTKVVVILALLAIVLYIAWAFRKISHPIPSWQYGIAALIALFHDVLIPIGVFSVLGKYHGVQVTIPIVTALLTVFGYSVNDTVVVFDRIRENLLKTRGIDYPTAVNQSLNQTLTRSINTSLTTLFVLFAIFFLGGITLRYFALALILGITSGTYSSIFIASPLLVYWLGWKKKI